MLKMAVIFHKPLFKSALHKEIEYFGMYRLKMEQIYLIIWVEKNTVSLILGANE